MAQEDPSRLVEWLLLVRKQLPVARRHLQDWLAAVRQEPVLIWETVAVRYAVYGLAGVVLLWGVTRVPGMLTPPPPANARPEATTADFHVVCSGAQCSHHFVIHRKFGFRKFPVECSRCKRKTGVQARRCHSPTCQGRWVAPQKVDGALCCSVCGGRFD